jgi:hypothetical protein
VGRRPQRRSRFVGLALPLGAAVTLAACTAWYNRPGAMKHDFARREQAEVWVRGRRHQVHAIRITPDSLVAVPYFRSPACDSCAVRFALRDVDSIRVRGTSTGRSIVAGIVAAGYLYLLVQISRNAPT